MCVPETGLTNALIHARKYGKIEHLYVKCTHQVYFDLTQNRVIWEEVLSVVKMLLTIRHMGAIFLVTDMGGTKSLWVALLLAGDPGMCEKAD